MSHFTEVKTKIRDRAMLEKALAALGLAVESNLKQGVDVRGFMGDKTRADLKVLTDTHYDIGFARNAEGDFEIIADWELMPKVAGIQRDGFWRGLSASTREPPSSRWRRPAGSRWKRRRRKASSR